MKASPISEFEFLIGKKRCIIITMCQAVKNINLFNSSNSMEYVLIIITMSTGEEVEAHIC